MKKVLGLLFISASMFSMQLDLVQQDKLGLLKLSSLSKVCINSQLVRAPERLGSVELHHGKKGFSLYQGGVKHKIEKHFTDKLLQGITREQLNVFLQNGHIAIKQMNEGDFKLEAKGHLNGGGPLFGSAMYWLTKTLCYGTAVAAVGTGVAVTGGAVVGAVGAAVGTGAVVGAGATATGAAITGTTITATGMAGVAATGATAALATTTTGVIATTGGVLVAGAGGAVGGSVAAAAGVIGTVAVNAGIGVEAAAVTAGVVSSIGTTGATIGAITTTVAAVESLSCAVGLFFGMLPTP